MQDHRIACYFLMGFLLLAANVLEGQDQRIADSLTSIYLADTLRGEAKMELLRNLSFNQISDYTVGLQYAEELIEASVDNDNFSYQSQGYFQKGNIKRLLGDLEVALQSFFKSAEIAATHKIIALEGSSYGAIADIYAISNNFSNAMLYYDKAISTLRKSQDKIALASIILNAGDALLNNRDYEAALKYFEESGGIFEEVNYKIGKAYNLGNIGMVYAHVGQNKIAEKNINEAIKILEELGDYYPISVYLIAMADIFIEKGDNYTALEYAQKSLDLAQQYGLKDQISDANRKLSELYEKVGDPVQALVHFKEYISYRDSVNNIRSVQNMADLRTNYEVSQKQIQVDLLEEQRRNQRNVLISLGVIVTLITVMLGTLIWYYRIISKEKERSEDLLLNILPAEIAEELKLNGKVDAVKFDQVTVLFTDFVQFSKTAEEVEPAKLVKSIDYYFRGFDEITSKYELEKIKTIGDAYMCACGLPSENPSHAKNVILAAREMIELVSRELESLDDLIHFEMRVGVHTGPVVAGIVGIKKWQYDIWGDTVNIASRMESNSEPGKINLSETTFEAIKDEFACVYRGQIELKNHEAVGMYFLV
jgi:class 3 adenylate cyclase